MTMENFTQKAQQAISESQQLALKIIISRWMASICTPRCSTRAMDLCPA